MLARERRRAARARGRTGAIETPINRDVQAIAWVASDQASYVTGTTLFVDGGMTLYPKFV